MEKAGTVLKKTLETHNISQNKLAVALGVKSYVVFRWFHEKTDPTGDSIANIAQALQKLKPAAAQEFVRLYLGEFMEDEEQTNQPE